jgi:hypothetical protein
MNTRWRQRLALVLVHHELNLGFLVLAARRSPIILYTAATATQLTSFTTVITVLL